jgi:flagellar protein FliO/FliZ
LTLSYGGMEIALEISRYIAALLLVLALIGVAGLAARKWGVPGVTKSVADKRLAIVETLMIGPRQKLFIIRRDNVEHLVFSSPDGACLVESGIPSSPASKIEPI